ncbi:hypothetical protein DEO72_LG5g2282 [Vigna unguiculata]|uniref:Uncharacterized protein n=1 Tax=Vigna unguiculata TaxID=3917 RepID=A0A4D6M0Y9_VIGUN|nr:hypothetical protein DEO72_LG5g2282 [Vigna unguiculata]
MCSDNKGFLLATTSASFLSRQELPSIDDKGFLTAATRLSFQRWTRTCPSGVHGGVVRKV